MRVRGLDGFLVESELVQTHRLVSSFPSKDTGSGSGSGPTLTTIGVDGFSFLMKLLLPPTGTSTATAAPPAVDGVSMALGSAAPFTLDARLTERLAQFKSHGLLPIVVFNGLTFPFQPPQATSRSSSSTSSLSSSATQPNAAAAGDKFQDARNAAWAEFMAGHTDKALALWGKEVQITLDLINHFTALLRAKSVTVLRAPFVALAQLAWLEKNRFTSFSVAPAEALVFGCARVILSFNFANPSFEFVDEQVVLKSLGVTRDQFVDACILVSSGFPAVSGKAAGAASPVASALDIVGTYGSGRMAVQELLDPSFHPEAANSYYKLAAFESARRNANHHPVAAFGGKIEPLNAAEEGLSALFGPLVAGLPGPLVKTLGLGLISPQLINSLFSGVFLDTPPPCGGDTAEYRIFLDRVDLIRAAAYKVLVARLLEQDKTLETLLPRRTVVKRWYEATEREIVAWPAAPLALPTATSGKLGFLAAALNADAASAAVAEHLGSSEQWEAGWAVLQIILAQVLSGDAFTTVAGSPFAAATGFSKKKMLASLSPLELAANLVSRVCVALKPATALTGPIWNPKYFDHSLIVVLSMVKSVQKASRFVFEAAGVGASEAIEIPFAHENQTASIAVLVKEFLLRCTSTADLDKLQSEHTRSCADVKAELKQAAGFWKKVVETLAALSKADLISKDVLALFQEANSIVKEKWEWLA